MKCLFCNGDNEKINLKRILIERDYLCVNCRNKLKLNRKVISIGNLKVETFYNYDGMFRDLLIQYKECCDEALAVVFLYLLKQYIRIKYHGYKILCVPSGKEKYEKRGFNHLELIFKDVGLTIINGLHMKQELVQEGKNLEDRRKMIGNYEYDGPHIEKVLIVDDVLTSGSSIYGVYMAIKSHVGKVRAISLSRKETAFIYKNKCV